MRAGKASERTTSALWGPTPAFHQERHLILETRTTRSPAIRVTSGFESVGLASRGNMTRFRFSSLCFQMHFASIRSAGAGSSSDACPYAARTNTSDCISVVVGMLFVLFVQARINIAALFQLLSRSCSRCHCKSSMSVAMLCHLLSLSQGSGLATRQFQSCVLRLPWHLKNWAPRRKAPSSEPSFARRSSSGSCRHREETERRTRQKGEAETKLRPHAGERLEPILSWEGESE